MTVKQGEKERDKKSRQKERGNRCFVNILQGRENEVVENAKQRSHSR